MHMTAYEPDESSEGSLPLLADPVTAYLVGVVVLFTLLMPASLVPLLVVLFVISVARRHHRKQERTEDTEFAARFRQLEDSVLETNEGE
jgi:1,4-dihydroxy-2-naphthoate octaprenyltransferase